MPSRVMRESLLASESMERVSADAQVVFLRLVLAVDDFGRLDARPAYLRSKLFPISETITSADVDRWLGELCAGEDAPVMLYEVEGKRFLLLTGWEEHRGKSNRGKNSKFPAPAEGEAIASPEIREIPSDPPVSRESGVEKRESRVPNARKSERRDPPPDWCFGVVDRLAAHVARRYSGIKPPIGRKRSTAARAVESMGLSEPVLCAGVDWLFSDANEGEFRIEVQAVSGLATKWGKVVAGMARTQSSATSTADRKRQAREEREQREADERRAEREKFLRERAARKPTGGQSLGAAIGDLKF